ncbi:MAG: Flp pilus assembly complex ATPase component TadA [Elusimicrobia bacterium]|nr:Flp pilus assembly complex ATPase component TadA [Elusimicrobiota bacterium]
MMVESTAFDHRGSHLGEILVNAGVITPDQLQETLKQCDPNQNNLGQTLVNLGFTTEDKMIQTLSQRFGIPYLQELNGFIAPEAARWIAEPLARRYLAVPLYKRDDKLVVAMVNPMDIHAVDDLARHAGTRIEAVITTLSNLFDAMQRIYGGRAINTPAKGAPHAADAASAAQLQAQEKSIIEMASSLLQEGMIRKASDIHLEPAARLLRVRFRVDGMLQDGPSFAKDLEAALVARIKILARLDITETRLPQDGHIRFEYGGASVDIRVSILPTVHGEKVVLRILDSSKTLRKLSDLGLSQANLKAFESAIRRPNGMLLVTGPTGSGKTTTLYAAIAAINDAARNIVTLEDPVEYRLDRINQVETFPKIGLTFAAGLRSILRQDPNVILVGEIRDIETAEIAVQAAITGHLVLSTLHTNDAASTIHRLINMRVEPFLVAAALEGVMAQRLMRRLCERCKREKPPSPSELEALEGRPHEEGPYFEAIGCPTCFQTGYAGRVAIHEWLTATRAIRELILQRASIDSVREAAKSEGWRSLQADALEKAARGVTSLAEVIRVTRSETAA